MDEEWHFVKLARDTWTFPLNIITVVIGEAFWIIASINQLVTHSFNQLVIKY